MKNKIVNLERAIEILEWELEPDYSMKVSNEEIMIARRMALEALKSQKESNDAIIEDLSEYTKLQ